MKEENKISNINEGWQFINDMLRAQQYCTDAQQVIDTLDMIRQNNRVFKIMRIKSRLVSMANKFTDVVINFDY